MSAQELSVHELSIRRHRQQILEEISLSVAPGEFVALIGPSGAGKSTLLSAMAGELKAATGEIRLMGRPLEQWTPKELATCRAVLPQSSSLAFPFPVLDVVLMGRAPYSGGRQTRQERMAALDALEQVGVGHLAARNYLTLSGGERQRVHFARALAQVGLERRDARFLLLDEPTASLDIAHAWSVLALAKELTSAGVGVFCVLHDLNLAARFADRIVLVADGRLRAAGVPGQVLIPTIIHEFFGVEVDVVDHPGAQTPLIVVRGAALNPNSMSESVL